jgi:hypothetical protein
MDDRYNGTKNLSKAPKYLKNEGDVENSDGMNNNRKTMDDGCNGTTKVSGAKKYFIKSVM